MLCWFPRAKSAHLLQPALRQHVLFLLYTGDLPLSTLGARHHFTCYLQNSHKPVMVRSMKRGAAGTWHCRTAPITASSMVLFDTTFLEASMPSPPQAVQQYMTA